MAKVLMAKQMRIDDWRDAQSSRRHIIIPLFQIFDVAWHLDLEQVSTGEATDLIFVGAQVDHP